MGTFLKFVVQCKTVGESSYSEALKNISKVLSETQIEILTENGGIDDIGILKVFGNLPHKLTMIEQSDGYEVVASGVLIFNSIHSLKDYNSKVVLKNEYDSFLKFYVIVRDTTENEISLLRDSPVAQFQYYLLDESSSIRLMTFVYYTPEKCKKIQLIQINKFDKKLRLWESDKFAIAKFDNFHDCRLVLAVFF